MIALYEATGGASWTNRDGWETAVDDDQDNDAPLNEWYGVIVHNGRVINLNLSSNNLT